MYQEIDFKQIQEKWKKEWLDKKIFETKNDNRKKWFSNAAFPYVNAPLHLGHGFTYTRIDVITRFKRMQGYNAMFPFAFHATGEPIVGVAERLKKGDEKQIKILLESGISEKDIDKFKDPKYTARYWIEQIKNDIQNLGISVDWTRSFTTIDPEFNRFIEWQYRKLKGKGYVTKGTHPVIWCPNCESPTGDHDRLEGEGETPVEYVIFKFRLPSGEILPLATLRPETVYGVTNVWINPDVEYTIADVDKETWIISKSCVEKLKNQLKSVKEKGTIKGEKLIGEKCINPILENEVLILPARFVDENNATGIVMSVPSHAPYDWIGLKDLFDLSSSKPEKLKEMNIDIEKLKEIKPIGLINLKGYSEHPAIDICNKMNIQSQLEKEKLDQATKQLYKKEFHMGILNEKCGEYKGMPVSEAKKNIIADFEKRGFISKIWEPSGKVICRCGTKCFVKILEDQWFLNFSDETWKEKARLCLRQMKIYPEQARKQFEDIIEWLQEKACARKSGLGTRLPWDQDWIVETLSDSVIYMAFYTIAQFMKEIEPGELNDEVFDYIFLGKEPKKTKLSKDLLEKMKKEFEYWYPFDIRGSAKELIPNHLTFCIFHHTAIWDDKCPNAFTVNGMLNIEGQKMSKSKGNFILLRDAIEKYGSDVVRIALMDSAEGMDDANWSEKDVFAWKNKLATIYRIFEQNYNKGTNEKTDMDIWLESRFQIHIKNITEALENMKNRSALTSFHAMLNDFQWYIKRTKDRNKSIVNNILENMIKCLSPFTPFICEEIWHKIIGKKNFISLEKWPEYDEKLINKEILQQEDNFKKIYEDIKQVIKLSGKNNKLFLYVITDKELNYLKKSQDFFKSGLGFKQVEIFKSDDENKYDPENKAKRAKFGKPGIYIE